MDWDLTCCETQSCFSLSTDVADADGAELRFGVHGELLTKTTADPTPQTSRRAPAGELPRGSGTFREHSSRLRPTPQHTHTHTHSIRVCSELTNRNTRVGYRFNLINSSSAYWFRFLSILRFNSNVVKTSEVKHLDIKHIYSVSLFARLRAVCVQNRAAWFWMNWDFFSLKWRL